MKKSTASWILLLVSLTTFVYSIVMGFNIRTSKFSAGKDIQLSSQIVQLETPLDVGSVKDLLRADDPSARSSQMELYRTSIRWDNVFLLLYPLQLIALAVFGLSCSPDPRARLLLVLGIVAIVFAGVCDSQENRGMSGMIKSFDQDKAVVLSLASVDETRHWSLGKWALFGIAYVLVGAALHQKIKTPPNANAPEMPPLGPWRLRLIILSLMAAGVASLMGTASFAIERYSRTSLVNSVYLAGLQITACATFWPRSRRKPIDDDIEQLASAAAA